MKKIFKIIGIILLIFVAILIAIPFVLESKIDTIVQNYADENLNANLSFDDISLSLISSFPKAEINVDNLKITNKLPFKGETLATAKSLSFEMPKENEDSNNVPADTTATAFSFDIENYELNNSAFTYIDEATNTQLYATEINHNGKGIFSGDQSELDTKTEARISMSIDSTEYLSNNIIKLDALIDLDLEQEKYTFKKNKGFINALPLEFEGYVQMVEAGQDIDISFKNPESSFKDFLAVIPKAYAKNIEGICVRIMRLLNILTYQKA